MYLNPFVAGVLATVMVELIILVIAAILYGGGGEE